MSQPVSQPVNWRWRERAEKVTPGGAQTRSKRRLFDYPVALQGAQYQHTWDREGNTYTDWISGLCAIGLGHGWPEVDEAVIRQVQDHGTCLSLPSYLEVEVAELLLETLGWGEQVRWVKTGSEATDGAMLIARQATGRRKIVSLGYHGWHLAHLPGPEHVCLPIGSIGAAYGHIDGDTAGVLVEPMRDTIVDDVDLRDLQQHCQDIGALFILDEIVTGFRWAIGGASEYFGITPDVACYGKAMANGYPIAAIVGSRRLMSHATGVSSTFGGECIGLAAARATIGVYRSEPVIETLWQTGQALKDSLGLIGYPCYPRFEHNAKEQAVKLAANGVLIHPGKGVFCPTFSHTEIDVQTTVKALCEP